MTFTSCLLNPKHYQHFYITKKYINAKINITSEITKQNHNFYL